MRDQYVRRQAVVTERVMRLLEKARPMLRVLKYRFPVEGLLLERAVDRMIEKVEKRKKKGGAAMARTREDRVLDIYAAKRLGRVTRRPRQVVSASSVLGKTGGRDGLDTDTGDLWSVEEDHIVRLFSREDAEELFDE